MTSNPVARYERRSDDYCRWRSWEPSEQRERYVYVHRLLATLLEDVDELGDLDGYDVHHVTRHRWFNVLELDVEIPELPNGELLQLRESVEHRSSHLHDLVAADGGIDE